MSKLHFKHFFLATALIVPLQSHAAIVTIGGLYDVDTDRGVASFANEAGGTIDATGHPYNDLTALGSNWGHVYDGGASADARRLEFNQGGGQPAGSDPNSSIEGTFTNAIVNNAGIDIILFESGDEPDGPPNTEIELMAASIGGGAGSWTDMVVLDFLTAAEVGGTGTIFGVYVYGLDLSDLGVGDGASVSSLFFGNTATSLDWDPDVVWGGAGTTVVPLPAAAWLFGSALLGLVGIGRRKKV